MGQSADPGYQHRGRNLKQTLLGVTHGRRWDSLRRTGEGISLLAAPVVVFFAWHVRAMPYTQMIDPFFYGAYALDGPDLLQRFGASNYFWPRVGFILPDRLFVTLFGPLGGFFSFRYVLALIAVVPLYILFRQVLGRGAAWLAVVVVLTAPVILTAWGSDYPDSSAVSYLMAGASCLFIKSRSPNRQWLWPVAAGVFLGLALNSQVVAVFVVIGIISGRVVGSWADGSRRIAADLARVTVAAVGVTATLVLFSELTTGHWDIFRPTIHAILMYRLPAEIAVFHSSTWRWLIDDIYVLLPPALIAAWLASAWPVVRRADISRAELGFAVATAVAFVLHVLAQFVAHNWTLEYYLYTSMLWATVSPLLVFTTLRVTRTGVPGAGGRSGVLLGAVALVGVPLVARAFRDQLQIGLGVALALMLVPTVGALVARLAGRWRAGRLMAALCVGGAATLLVVGMPMKATIYPGQVAYYTPDYGRALFEDSETAVDEYTIFASLHQVVPTASQLPGGLAMWWAASRSSLVAVSGAQYLWVANALPQRMPALDAQTRGFLYARRPRVLLLMSDTGTEFRAAVSALTRGGFGPATLRDATLRAGKAVLFVRVLELSAYPSP